MPSPARRSWSGSSRSTPRLPYGSNCAAHWGLLYDAFGKERITIYGLDDDGAETVATPEFAYDFTDAGPLRRPGRDHPARPVGPPAVQPPVRVPVRPHLGVMGVAPAESGRINSIPPGSFGGNVDNWRLGAGAAMAYPVFTPAPGSTSAIPTSPRATVSCAARRSRRRST